MLPIGDQPDRSTPTIQVRKRIDVGPAHPNRHVECVFTVSAPRPADHRPGVHRVTDGDIDRREIRQGDADALFHENGHRTHTCHLSSEGHATTRRCHDLSPGLCSDVDPPMTFEPLTRLETRNHHTRRRWERQAKREQSRNEHGSNVRNRHAAWNPCGSGEPWVKSRPGNTG